jgi:putative ABC transport system ATP-binding protein
MMKITAEDIGMRIDGQVVLFGESLDCEPATMTALIGPSGCGKTTLLHCLGLLQKPISGKVLVDGTDTSIWKPSRIRRFWRDHAAFVIQDYGIVDDEPVAYNVTMTSSLVTHRVRGDRGRWEEALEAVGLAGRGNDAAAHLSGGEKKRLAIARAIYKDADVILIDEPTASLDAANRRGVIELFAERADAGCTVIVATHDEEMMAACTVRHQVGSARRAERGVEVAR